MRSRFVSGLLQMALLLLSACGAGFPDAPTAETAIALQPDADTTALTAFTEQHRWTCADCARLTDVGLRNECQTCCAAGAGAFQGCDVRGNVFDPLTCRCVATPPGDSKALRRHLLPSRWRLLPRRYRALRGGILRVTRFDNPFTVAAVHDLHTDLSSRNEGMPRYLP